MSLGKDGAIDKARKLVALLNSNGIDVYEAYMFGSAVINEINEYSDIDVAIVLDKFTGVPFYDALKISKFRRAIDLKLEVHSFSLKDILNDLPIFFVDIKYRGIRVN